MLGSAAEVLKESIIIIALIIGVFQPASAGLLVKLASVFRTMDFTELMPTLLQIASIIIIIAAVFICLYFTVSVITSGFLNSAEYGSYMRLIRIGTISIPEVLSEIRGRWIRMAWTVFVVELIKNIPFLIYVAWLIVDIANLSSMNSFQMMIRPYLWLQLMLIAMVFL